MIICNYYYFIYYLVENCQSDSSSSGFNGVPEVAANDYTMPMNHRHQAKMILRHETRILNESNDDMYMERSKQIERKNQDCLIPNPP